MIEVSSRIVAFFVSKSDIILVNIVNDEPYER